MNVKKRFRPFLLRFWKQLFFEGFDISETQFRNCGNCVQTLLFVQSGVSKLVRVNGREKTVQTLPFTLLKAAAFWRFWHVRDTISKLRKLCSDITLSLNLPQFSSSRKWTRKNGLDPLFYALIAAALWKFWHMRKTFQNGEKGARLHLQEKGFIFTNFCSKILKNGMWDPEDKILIV